MSDFGDMAVNLIGAVADAYVKGLAIQKISEWADITDLEDLQDAIQGFVVTASIRDLELIDEMFEGQLRLNAMLDEPFKKRILVFTLFHRAWAVREYRQRR